MTHLYPSVADLAGHNGGRRAWDRAVEALSALSPQDPPHARSVGDSVTYWVTGADALSRPELVAHRMYQTLLHPLTGDLELTVAGRSGLEVLARYRDTDDVELLDGSGAGSALRVPVGAVALVGLDEGWRVAPGSVRVAVLRLTGEAPPARPVAQVAPGVPARATAPHPPGGAA
ncbi:MAG TPA: hypothetical protein VGC67_17930 [Cellulomonas sp.]